MTATLPTETILARVSPEGDEWDEIRIVGHMALKPDVTELAVIPTAGFYSPVTVDESSLLTQWRVTERGEPDHTIPGPTRAELELSENG